MHLYFSLLAGLVIALALQLMLSNLGIALGLTLLGGLFKSGSGSSSKARSQESQFSLPLLNLVGFGVALSLSSVLFAAAWLMGEFSQVGPPRRGAILGLVLWALYLLLFIWLSSTTLSGIVDSALGAVAAGGRQLAAALRQLLGSEASDQQPSNSMATELEQLAAFQQRLPELLEDQQEALLAEVRQVIAEQRQGEVPQTGTRSLTSASAGGSLSQLMPNWRRLLRQLLSRIDWSDWDVEAIWQKLQSQPASEKTAEPAIWVDVKEYLSYTPVWSLRSEILQEEFEQQLYDPEAAPEQLRSQLDQLSRTQFIQWLQQRGDLAEERIEAVADQLTDIYDAVGQRLQAAMPQADSQASTATDQPRDPNPGQNGAATLDSAAAALAEVQEKLLAYCRYTNLDKLSAESLAEKLQDQLEEQALLNPHGHLPGHLDLDLEAVEATLARRQGIAPGQQAELLETLQSSWASLQSASPWQTLTRPPRRWAERTGRSLETFLDYVRKKIAQYLRYQDKSAFTPSQIAQDIGAIFRAGLRLLPSVDQLTDWVPDLNIDRQAWRQALEQRRDMGAEEIQQRLDWLESAWQQAAQQLGDWLSFHPVESMQAARQQLLELSQAAQTQIQAQANALTAEMAQQVNRVRRRVAIAAWWLFLSLLTSGVAAAAGGWLAARY